MLTLPYERQLKKELYLSHRYVIGTGGNSGVLMKGAVRPTLLRVRIPIWGIGSTKGKHASGRSSWSSITGSTGARSSPELEPRAPDLDPDRVRQQASLQANFHSEKWKQQRRPLRKLRGCRNLPRLDRVK